LRQRTLVTAGVLMLIVFSAGIAAGRFLAAAPRLPGPALNALTAHVGSSADASATPLRLLEVRPIGPDIAVIYRVGAHPGALLLSGGRDEWTVAAEVTDPGPLGASSAGTVGAADLVANGLHVVFVAIGDTRVGQVMVRFPDDATALKAPRHGDYAILWRPAANLPSGFVIETYDRRGRPLFR
jgi:hypothetical protein